MVNAPKSKSVDEGLVDGDMDAAFECCKQIVRSAAFLNDVHRDSLVKTMDIYQEAARRVRDELS